MSTFGAAGSRFPEVVLADVGEGGHNTAPSLILTQCVIRHSTAPSAALRNLFLPGAGHLGGNLMNSVERFWFTAQGGEGCVTRPCKVH